MPVAETETIGGTRPMHFELLRDVPVDAILQTAAMATEVEVKRWGGAIARGTTPAGHRHVPFSVTVNGPGIAPLKGARHRRLVPELAARRPARRATRRRTSRGCRSSSAAYDPDNVFGVGRELAPAAHAVAA